MGRFLEKALTKKITLQDIGRRLGLSSTTISLALRDHPRISKATKDRVRELIAELKYEPDQVARALVVGHSNLIGVIVPNSSDTFYAEVFKGIEDAVQAANYHVLLSNGSYDLDGYGQRLKEMMGLRVGGFIIAPPFYHERPRLPGFMADLRDRDFPVVLINRRLKPPVFHQVTADYTAGMKMVIDTLASLGHHRVAYASREPALVPMGQRYSDFRRQAARHRFGTDPNLVATAPLNSAGGYDAARRLWAAVEPKPTAIVALSDTVAMGVLRFLLDEKIQVPAEVSLISFDGVAASEFTHPSITTVATPLYEIGQQAFQVFLGAIGHRFTEPQNVILPVKLIPRESVGVARKERAG